VDASPSSIARTRAAKRIAGAAASLARASIDLEDEPVQTRTLMDYVAGWVNRLLIEVVEPSADPEDDAPPIH